MSDKTRGHLEKTLVSHIVDQGPEALTAEAELAARKEILWCVGTSIAGARATGSDAISEYLTDIGGRPEATVFGTGQKAPTHLAAFANSTYAKALEYEDKAWMGTSHGFGVGMAVVPAAFAVAESIGGVDQRTFVNAVAVATDFHMRIMSALPNSSHGKSGFNSSYVFWVFGATAAACKIMGLRHEQTSNALGLAYAQAAGNYQGQIEGVLGVRLQGGFAGRNAVMAAQLASRGTTGVAEFLTGECGLYPLYYGHMTPDLDSISDGLGAVYRGERLGFKAYPCGLVCHASLDAIRGLMASNPVDVSSISRIRVYGGERLGIMTEPREHRRNPRNFVEAQFSIAWAAACTLLHGTLRLAHFEKENLDDPHCRRLSNLVDVDIVEGRKEQYVELELDNGTVLQSEKVTVAHGHPDNPLTEQEIRDVFQDCLNLGPDSSVSASAAALPELLLGDPSSRFTTTAELTGALQRAPEGGS